MKKLLKSLMVLSVVAMTTVSATAAYFTTTVTAADNLITTGTIRLALASTIKHDVDASSGYWLAYDLDGVSTDVANFEAWTNAEPGTPAAYPPLTGVDTFAAGNASRWVAVANNGTLDEQYRFNKVSTGRWTAIPRATTNPLVCGAWLPDGSNADASLVNVQKVYRYANGGGVGECENHEECQNLRGWLIANSYTATTSVAGDATVVLGVSDESAAVTLQPNEFQIYRVDLNLNSATHTCYQGATYTYDMSVDGKQVLAPTF